MRHSPVRPIIYLFLLSGILISSCDNQKNGTEETSTNIQTQAQLDVANKLMNQALQELNLGDTPAARLTYEKARIAYVESGDKVGEGRVYLGLAQLEHFTGQSDQARKYYSNSVDLFTEIMNYEWLAKTLVAWGDLEKDTFNWNPAIDLYRKARIQWELAAEPKSTKHVMLKLSSVPKLEINSAISILEQADLIYRNLDDKVGLADIKMFYGKIKLNQGNLNAAHAYYNDARFLYSGENIFLEQAKAETIIIEINIARGLNLRASKMIELAADTHIAAENMEGLADLHIARGDLERLQGRIEIAKDHYSKAVQEFSDLEMTINPVSLLKLAEVNIFLNNIDESIKLLEQSINLFNKKNDLNGQSYALLAMGIAKKKSGDLSNAKEILIKANSEFKELNNLLGIARSNIEIAEILRSENDENTAKKYVEISKSAFESLNLPLGVSIAYLTLAEIAKYSEDPLMNEAAASYYNLAMNQFTEVEKPLKEMNIILGLSPTDTILEYGKNTTKDLYDELAGGLRTLTPEDIAAIAENKENFPNNLIEGKNALDNIKKRIFEGMRDSKCNYLLNQ